MDTLENVSMCDGIQGLTRILSEKLENLLCTAKIVCLLVLSLVARAFYSHSEGIEGNLFVLSRYETLHAFPPFACRYNIKCVLLLQI